jgi:hypothetical protein
MELIYPQLAEMLRAYALGIAAANDKLKTQIQLTEEGLKFDEGTVKAFRESGEAYKKFTDDLAENIKQLNFEADAVLMSTKQREIAIKMLEAEHKGLQENSKDWVEYREKVIAAVERKESLQAIADLWKGIENAAHDAFMNIYEGGKLTFERLRDSLKNTLLELLYQMTVKKWIINIGTNLTSEGGGGGIGSSLMSGFGGNIGSIVSGAGSLFGASGFAAGAAGDAFLPAALAGTEGLAGTAGALAGAGFGATAAMAIPYVGIAIAVGMLVKSYLDSKRGGPKVGGFAGVGEAFFTGETTAAGSAAAKKIVDQIGVSFNETIKRLGGKPGGIGFSLGYDTDPQGSAMSRVIAAVYAGNANIYKSINASVGRSPEELQAELTAQTKKMLIVALQSADLPGALGKLFARINVEAISGDAVDNLVQFAEAYGELADLFNASPLDDALKAIKEQAGGAQKALENQADALSKMIDVYDGSAQATTDLSAATSAYYKNVVAVIAQVEQLKTQIADLFASSIKDYTFAKLDTSGKYKYLKDDAEKLYQELQGATDANRIDALAKLIDSDMREAFGLLTPEQQAQLADEFIKGANETSKIAAEQLQKVQQAAEERSQSVLTTIQTALEAAAEKIAAGGDAVIVGGNAITNAAQYIVDATARTSLVTG